MENHDPGHGQTLEQMQYIDGNYEIRDLLEDQIPSFIALNRPAWGIRG